MIEDVSVFEYMYVMRNKTDIWKLMMRTGQLVPISA